MLAVEARQDPAGPASFSTSTSGHVFHDRFFGFVGLFSFRRYNLGRGPTNLQVKPTSSRTQGFAYVHIYIYICIYRFRGLWALGVYQGRGFIQDI